VRVVGHSLDELDTLRDEYDALVARALDVTASALVQRSSLTSSAIDDRQTLTYAWEAQVDNTLVPHLAAIYDGASLSAAHQLADGLPLGPGAGIPSVPPDGAIEYLRGARNRLTGIDDDIWQHVQSQLVEGVRAGESTEQLALRVHAGGELSLPRARTVARTEVNGASNAGAYAQVAFLGLEGTQEWLATSDGRTREDHVLADGETTPLGGTFTVGGYTLRYPGDPGAPVSEIVNCRCTVAYDVADEVPAITCDPYAPALVAAGQVHIHTTSTQVDTPYCVTTPSQFTTTADAGKLAALNDEQRWYVYSTFMYPSKISPTYGGAKIHKHIQATRDALKATGKSELADLGPNEILHIVDSKYAGKFTFRQKYDDWLSSSAGQKMVPNAHKVMNVLTEAEQTTKKIDAVVAETAKPVDVTPNVAPSPTVAKSVDAPVKTDKGHVPLAQQPGDIAGIPVPDKEAFYQAYKKEKVTAVWSGNKIWEALQSAKKGFLFNDHEALKILDERFGVHGGSTGYLDKILKWEQSPAGKKVLGEVPAGVEVKPAAGKIGAKLENLGAKPTPVPAPGPTTTAPAVDLSTIPSTVKKLMVSKLNAGGPILGKPPVTVYKKILEIKKYAKGQGHELSDLEVLRVLDAEKAAQLGVENKHLFETKIVEWLKTPSGKAAAKSVASEATSVVETGVKKTTKTTSTATDISLHEMRAKISTTDKSFPNISTSEAYQLQSSMESISGEWSTDQRGSLRFYTGSNYTAMNGALRGNSRYASSVVRRYINNAQAAMRPSTRPITVYRGTSVTQFGGVNVDESLVGKTFEDKGFMSTSVGDGAVFARDVLLEIECPTGTPMAFVKSVSHYPNEDEMLLAAGTRYQVISVKTTDITQPTWSQTVLKTVVRVRVVP
jgi:hypothetical protein